MDHKKLTENHEPDLLSVSQSIKFVSCTEKGAIKLEAGTIAESVVGNEFFMHENSDKETKVFDAVNQDTKDFDLIHSVSTSNESCVEVGDRQREQATVSCKQEIEVGNDTINILPDSDCKVDPDDGVYNYSYASAQTKDRSTPVGSYQNEVKPLEHFSNGSYSPTNETMIPSPSTAVKLRIPDLLKRTLRDGLNMRKAIPLEILLPCPNCDKCFGGREKLKEHLKTHAKKKPYACQHCDRKFRNRGQLSQHSKVHSKEKPYLCETCGRSFVWMTAYTKHVKSHTGMKPFSCDNCKKCFADKMTLVKHLRVHTGEKPYWCTECGNRFSQRQNLVAHVLTHKGGKRFGCDVCGKTYSRKSGLAAHAKIHSKGKTLACTYCEKAFFTKRDLSVHINVHTGKKPYVCQVCAKAFSQRPNLITHSRVHLDVRPFSCDECGNSFKIRSHMLRHKLIHQGITRSKKLPK